MVCAVSALVFYSSADFWFFTKLSSWLIQSISGNVGLWNVPSIAVFSEGIFLLWSLLILSWMLPPVPSLKYSRNNVIGHILDNKLIQNNFMFMCEHCQKSQNQEPSNCEEKAYLEGQILKTFKGQHQKKSKQGKGIQLGSL